jgi:hypothetical protein
MSVQEDKATVGSVAMQSRCGKTSPDSSGADESSPGSHFSPGSACGCQKPIAQVPQPYVPVLSIGRYAWCARTTAVIDGPCRLISVEEPING